MSVVYMSFSAEMLHYGHIKIMKEAAKLGDLIIGVLTDDVIAQYKKPPLITFENRCKIFEDFRFVSKVVKKDTLSYEGVIKRYHPDYVVHGDDWKTGPKLKVRNELLQLLEQYGGKLIEFPYNMEDGIQLLESSLKKQYSMPEVRRGALKRLLNTKSYIRVMEAHDGLTGLIVENSSYQADDGFKEFDALWESSLCDSTSRGKPDIELIDWSERISRINEIMDVTTKPIIVDGDTGGEIERFSYIVQNLEKIGVSAVIIEDKIGPKRNSLFGTEVLQTQDTPQHFAEKIRTAKAALKTHDFMIIARIESLILEKGMEDALYRAENYVAAGADGIMIHSKSKTPDEVYVFCEKFRKKFRDIPIVLVPTTYNQVTEKELAEHGANIIIHANHLIRSAFPAMEQTALAILKNGCSFCVDKQCMPVKKIISFIPINEEK